MMHTKSGSVLLFIFYLSMILSNENDCSANSSSRRPTNFWRRIMRDTFEQQLSNRIFHQHRSKFFRDNCDFGLPQPPIPKKMTTKPRIGKKTKTTTCPTTTTTCPTTTTTCPTTTTTCPTTTTTCPTTTAIISTLKCARHSTLVGNQCLYLSPSSATWHDAFKTCKDAGGELHHPINLQEHTLLTTHLNANNKDIGASWWLGGTDEAEEGKWVWRHDNSTIGYNNWLINQPDNKNNEDCLQLLIRNGQYKWDDADCRLPLKFICRFPTITPTTPTITTASPTITAATPTTAKSKLSCAKLHYTLVGDQCLYLSTFKATWHDAFKACKDVGGELHHPKNLQEHALLTTHLDAINRDIGASWWLGGTDEAEEGKWVWKHDNSAIGYNNWLINQPDNKNNEDCLELLIWNGEYKWDDADCRLPLKFLCRFPATITTTPTTTTPTTTPPTTTTTRPTTTTTTPRPTTTTPRPTTTTPRPTTTTPRPTTTTPRPTTTTPRPTTTTPRPTTTTPRPTTTTPTTTTTTPTTTTPALCRTGYFPLDDQCFHFSNQSATRSDASVNCRNDGGELAHPINLQQHLAMGRHLMAFERDSKTKYWIGGTDRGMTFKDNITDRWVWDHNNITMGYNNWIQPQTDAGVIWIQQPDQLPYENCMELVLVNGRYGWNDSPCSSVSKYICQMPQLSRGR